MKTAIFVNTLLAIAVYASQSRHRAQSDWATSRRAFGRKADSAMRRRAKALPLQRQLRARPRRSVISKNADTFCHSPVDRPFLLELRRRILQLRASDAEAVIVRRFEIKHTCSTSTERSDR